MSTYADYLFTNAAVFTADLANPRAEAVAVRGNRIVFVGRSTAAAEWQGPHTEVIDAGGRSLLPGLIDSHFHLLWGSLKLDKLRLDEAESLDAIAAAIAAYAAANPQREWIEGVQLKYSAISAGARLDRWFLDAIAPDRPVYLTAFDGHTVWANSEAMRRGDLLGGREVAPGSEIVMDAASGTASGELREPGAFDPVRALIPPPTEAERRAALRKGLALCARHGLTSVHNMDNWNDGIAVYAALEALGEMSVRVYVPYNIEPETPVEKIVEAAELKRRYQGNYVRAGAVKVFMDGVLESYTALMVDDYADQPGNRGGALHTAARFNAIAAAADRLELQIFVHACGDGAVRRTLDGYAHVRRVNGPRDSRHRVEHIEVIHPDDIARFAELGVIASMQPAHCPPTLHTGDVWPNRAGAGRWRHSFAWQTLREAGARQAYGSDWPVATMNPLVGLGCGLLRQPWQAGDPVQNQPLEDLIIGYTRAAAYAEFQEDQKGMIRTGMLADLVLLDADLFATPPSAIEQVLPVLTMVDGRAVFRQV
ncbi:amidohydrolase [Caldilinea sp.]|uniref:amidohydrolase n=1 Tax=Caldilinea sp. TaxID=2293560 RepID=UPI002CAA1AC1|nr:amidohydrolase [Caldilinea sp.]